MKSSKIILSGLISIMFVTAASAAWVPVTNQVLLTSLPGGALVVGDKEFSNFDLNVFMIDGGAFMTDPNLMKVQGVMDVDTGDYGLRFNGFTWFAGPNQVISVNLGFKVSIIDGYDDYFIKDIWMYLTGAGATGTGSVNAGETAWDDFPGGNVVASLSCSKYAGDGGVNLSDYAEFDPLKEIYIQTKYITLIGGTNGTASFTEFFQFYSQIPEPATIVLLGAASIVVVTQKKALFMDRKSK
ncbi:MAG: hypothetical protein JW947_03630 [Sedimentisphaerales bacterium]|nr:hypothetical protein [Sedimentisphaerales bacterium]